MQSEAPAQPPALGIKEIMEILPHRYPFLMVDRILDIDLENSKIVGIKGVTMNEEFFQGHFPGAPIMPGVLILEALAQTAGILIHEKGHKNKTAVLLSVNHGKFRNPVHPGDTLYLHAEGIHFSGKGGKVKGRAIVNGKLAVEAEIGFALREMEQI